ncbi:MAG TPA: RHS repeat-associated core domain-containing protein [Bryobacteraceae bacterium]|jgi:RHS repeat-associated protein
MRSLTFLALLASALSASAQCYQFSGPGATLKINITLVVLQTGPIYSNGYSETVLTFSGDNTFTVNGSTLTSQSIVDGTANVQYTPSIAPGLPDHTEFTIAVPNADPNISGPGEHSWAAYLAGTGDLIPTRLLPGALPVFASWTGIGGSNYIEVASGGARTKYPITSVGTCGSTTGGGGTGGGSAANGPGSGNPNNLPGSCNCGDPINVGNGNLFEQFADYQTYGPNPLAFSRYYNSLPGPTTFATELGPSWRHTYDRYLRLASASSVIAERADGQQVTFTLTGGSWTTDSDIDLKLTNSGITWTLTDRDDTVETYTVFNAPEALLRTIQTRNGYAQTLQYNSNSQLTGVTDSFNRSLTFLYQGNLLHSVLTPDNLLLGFNYVSGQLGSVNYSTTTPSFQSYLYELPLLPNVLTGITDENGSRFATFTYDASARALTSQHAGGADLTTVTYNDTDGSRTVTNALGLQETYKFATLQGVPKVTEADRASTSTTAAAKSFYTYDSNGFLASHTDWNGNVTNYTNDAHGQHLSLVEAANTLQARTTTINYHATYHLPLKIVTPGLTTSFVYDASGQILTKTQTDTTTTSSPYSTAGQSRVWTYSWANFNEASVQSPRTDLYAPTKFTYDATGALITISDALNHLTQITQHTPGGLPQSVVDPNGVTTNYTYDARLRLLSLAVSAPNGPVFTTGYTYDAAGNLTTSTLPDGSYVANFYDAAHRLNSVSDSLGDSISWLLNPLGNHSQTLILDSNATLQLKRLATFDALGRQSQDTGGANQLTTTTFDPNGNPLTVTDPLNHTTQQTFDALNRPTKLVNPAQGVASFVYDLHNRPTSVTDPNGVTTTYTYDGFGDLIQQTRPTSGTVTYRYDASGNLTQRIDARGIETDFTYDALDRLTSTKYPGNIAENITYGYDQPGHTFGIGRLTTADDATGTLNRNYDERGNLQSESRSHSGIILITSYNYDKASRVQAVTYPSKWTVTYSRDAMGRIASAIAIPPGGGAPKSLFQSATYLPFGPPTAINYANHITETRTFDHDYRLLKISSSVQSLTYGYDNADNVLSLSDSLSNANSQTFGYDILNRLTSATGPYGSPTYTYDANGNRLTDSSAPTSQDGLGTITALTYNQANRLSIVSAGSKQLAQYTYDAFGRRVVKVGATTATTLYTYDRNSRLLEESDGTGNAKVDYIYLDDRPVATLQPSTGQIYFLHDDRLGAPQLATGSDQTIAWSTTYQPFGQISTPPTTITQNLRLPGQESDPDTGLNHNGFRDYAPNLGRYLTSDPLGLSAALNTYAYASSNPLKQIDPRGLCDVADQYYAREYAGDLNFYTPDGFWWQTDGQVTLNTSIHVADYEAMTGAEQLAYLSNLFVDAPGSRIAQIYQYLNVYENRHPAPICCGIRG